MRWLLKHEESDCLFEVFDEDKLDECLASGCEDVSNIEVYEDAYLLKKAEEANEWL